MDFDGSKSCYAHDSRGRQTVRIEGLPGSASCASALASGATLPTGARTASTTWHDDWHLRRTTVAPSRRTTHVHHGTLDPFTGTIAVCTSAPALPDGAPLPILCKRVEQALLPSGAIDPGADAVSETFAYDPSGKLLSSTDANVRTRTYSYHQETSYTGGPYDAHFDGVVLLLHGNGVDGSRIVVDNSSSAAPVASIGAVRISAAQSRFGGASIHFDGSSGYLSLPGSSDWDLGNRDFTAEAWVRFNDLSSARSIVGHLDLQANPFKGWILKYDPAQAPAGLRFVAFKGDASNGNDAFQLAWTPTTSAWYHVAAVRSGSSMRFYVDGELIGSGSLVNATTIAHAAGRPLMVGAQDSPGGPSLLMARDSRGNSVSHTLDETGHRVREEVRDPDGTLRRDITRSFDVLGRLQQISGGSR